jgi:cytidyltransferase-like protein
MQYKRDLESKSLDLLELSHLIKREHFDKKIGLCHGVFDVIHSGHMRHFQEASRLVDILIVSVTTDSEVNKGPGRPINKIKDRIDALAAIEYIDFVVESKSPSSVEVITKLSPQIYFKGKDYSNLSTEDLKDPAGNLEEENKVVEMHGGIIYFTSSELRSSSSIINSYSNISSNHSRVSDHVKKFLDKRPLEKIISEIKNMKIGLIGEVIKDEYIFTESLGKSGKHPLVAQRELYRKEFMGGIFPVMDTINSFVNKNNLYVTSVYGSQELINSIPFGNKIIFDPNYTNISKIRYINEKTNTFLFETYKMDDKYINEKNEKLLLQNLQEFSNSVDLLIALDFGHGLITPKLRKLMCSNFNNFALNVQKNAGNKGNSSIGKYAKAKVIVLNGEEVELELRQKGINIEEAALLIFKNI